MKTIKTALIIITLAIFNSQNICGGGGCNSTKDTNSKGSKIKTDDKDKNPLNQMKDFNKENLKQDISGFFQYSLDFTADNFIDKLIENTNKFIEEYKKNDIDKINESHGGSVKYNKGVKVPPILYKNGKYKLIDSQKTLDDIEEFLDKKEIGIFFDRIKNDEERANDVLYRIEEMPIPDK